MQLHIHISFLTHWLVKTILIQNYINLVYLTKRTGHNKFARRSTLSGVGAIEHHTYSVNITNTILLALRFELTQKYLATKSHHC